MIIEIFICAVFLVSINIMDIKSYKIKNAVVLPTVLIGLIYGIVQGDFLDSLYGMLIPLVLFPLFALRMLGAGDVKALCAIGSILGFKLSVMTLLWTFISGGVIAIVFMILNGNCVQRFKYLFNYLKMFFVTLKPEEYNYGGDKKSYFRFSYAITVGTALAIVINHFYPHFIY